jgi:Mlc titration factor MtfA (ptsG expression regulator)
MIMKLKPWQYVGVPLMILTAAFFSIGIYKSIDVLSMWGAAAFIILAALYVMSPQIDFWWFKRNPPPLTPVIERLINDNFSYYNKLNAELKARFRQRLTLYIMGNEFIRPVNKEDSSAMADRNRVPEDLKAAAAAHAIQVSFGREKYMTEKFEHIIIYPHPFPSPQYNYLHTSEIFEEDGVLLLTSDPMMIGFQTPQTFFSIGLYEYARIYKMLNPSASYPNLVENTWWDLEQVSGMSKAAIEKVVGLEDLDLFGVAAHHFFTFPDRMLKLMPDLYTLLSNVFNQNPVNGANPILNT